MNKGTIMSNGQSGIIQARTNRPEKYLYITVLAFLITGLLIAGYVLIYSRGVSLKADIPRALLASYLIGISLIVFQSYGRNAGLSLLLSLMVPPCIPLAIGMSWLFPLMALGFTVVAWLRRREIGESIGRVGNADIATLIVASSAFAAITITSSQAAGLYFLSDVQHELLNTDALYHSAITAMIKNYGVSSVGLDGLVTRHYHVLSHTLFAAMSFGTGLAAMTSFGTLQFFLLEPLLLLAIVATAETIRPSANARSFFIRIVVLFIAFRIILVWPAFAESALWDSYFESQSYGLSLILMLATICATRMEREGYRLLTLVALALLTTASKVSTGAICVAMVVMHLAFFDPGTRVRHLIAGISMILGFGILFYLETSHVWITQLPTFLSELGTSTILKYGLIITVAVTAMIGLFLLLLHLKALRKYAIILACISCVFYAKSIAAYFEYLWMNPIIVKSGYFMQYFGGIPEDSCYPEFWPALGRFTLVHFFFTWLLVVLAANLNLFDRSKAKYLDAPLIYSMIALCISWLVLFLTEMGSAEYYFTNVAMFIALPYLLTILSERIGDGILARTVEGGLLVVLTGTLFGVFNGGKGLVNFMTTGTVVVTVAQQKTRMIEAPADKKFAQMISYLEEIRRDSSTKNLGVYIARKEFDFWASGPLNASCLKRPFIIPAVSERPGLLALPDLVCLPRGYGYDDYRHEAFEMSVLPQIPHEVLLKLAVEAGLDGYIDVHWGGWTIYRRERQNGAVATAPKNGLKQ